MHLRTGCGSPALDAGFDAGKTPNRRKLLFIPEFDLPFLSVWFMGRAKRLVEISVETVPVPGILNKEQDFVRICFSGSYSIYSVSLAN